MPRKLTSQEYSELVQSLERMADGIAKNATTADFPVHLTEAKVRALRQQIEDLRSKYELHMSEGERLYDAYSQCFDVCTAELAKAHDSLRGFYGKDNAMLTDYGTKLIAKPPGRNKKKE